MKCLLVFATILEMLFASNVYAYQSMTCFDSNDSSVRLIFDGAFNVLVIAKLNYKGNVYDWSLKPIPNRPMPLDPDFETEPPMAIVFPPNNPGESKYDFVLAKDGKSASLSQNAQALENLICCPSPGGMVLCPE